MFVRRSLYDETRQRAIRAELQAQGWYGRFASLQANWNSLVERINALGGENFLRGQGQSQFSAEDVQRLIQLCHPDKHDGKPMAKDMTVKLLALRQQLEK